MIGGADPKVGDPTVAGSKVTAEVARQGKHPKVLSFKSRMGRWAKIRGHRQLFTELKITKIEG